MRILAVLLALTSFTDGLNVLFYYAAIGPSHISCLKTAVTKLVARGHTVDVVFAVYNEIVDLELGEQVRRVHYNRHADGEYWRKNANHLTNMFEKTSIPLGEFETFHESGYQLCKIAMNDTSLFHFLRTGDYDIGVSSDYDPCGNILMTAVGVPSIASFLSTPIFFPNLANAGMPNVASVLATPWYPEHDGSFYAKIFNLARLTYYHYVIAPDLARKYNKLISERFGSDFPSVEQIERDVDVVFVNSHELLEKQRPLAAKVKFMGGMGVKKARPLPERLHNILTAPTVLFSFGTQVPTVKMPLAIRKSFVDAFKKLPNVTFLWKYDEMADGDLFDGAPNVHRLAWLPQTDLLHDHRVKVFISHMGLNSYLESATAGVPVLAIPLFGDQQNNAQNARDRGLGLLVDRDQLTTDNIFHALNLLLTDPKYQRNAKSMSKKLSEKPEKGEDIFVRWLEFAAENPGLRHVYEMPGAEMSPFYYYCGDVIALFFLITLVAYHLIFARISVTIRPKKLKIE